jgi:Cysteine-rich secretory protein family
MPLKCLFVVMLCIIARSAVYSQVQKPMYKDTAFIAAILQQHNVYRSALHLPLLSWSPELASDAQAWAQNLARTDKGQHDLSIRGREGENLWWGTAGAFGFGEMVGFWGNEKKDFVYGTYPDCKSSNSAVVGHYTQVIWRSTTSVGCALVGNGKNDYLVCRYSPPGNEMGQKPY